MIDKKHISLELKLYTAFVDGMMTFQQTLVKDFSFIEEQDLVNFMHAEGTKYVIERMKIKP